jgi:hypothetical protein
MRKRQPASLTHPQRFVAMQAQAAKSRGRFAIARGLLDSFILDQAQVASLATGQSARTMH